MLSQKQYAVLTAKNAPKSQTAVCCVRAFFIGGSICAAGQGLLTLYGALGFDELNARTLTSVTLIFFGVLLTALGQYDRLARIAGAGTLVPITGFANAVSASAIEFRSEGLVTGLGAKMFTIAGSVLVYGSFTATLYGAVLWILHLFGVTLF